MVSDYTLRSGVGALIRMATKKNSPSRCLGWPAGRLYVQNFNELVPVISGVMPERNTDTRISGFVKRVIANLFIAVQATCRNDIPLVFACLLRCAKGSVLGGLPAQCVAVAILSHLRPTLSESVYSFLLSPWKYFFWSILKTLQIKLRAL